MSANQWWILGWAPCGSDSCPTVLGTADAGTSFVALPAPGGRYARKAGTYPSVSQIRFANREDGWVFGPDLYATHDGGQQWIEIPVSGSVTSLAAGFNSVFAIVDPPYNPCSHTGTCTHDTPHPELWRAVPSSNDWQPDVAAGCVSGGLAVHQRQVWVMNCANTPDGAAIGSGLLHSSDSGGTFSGFDIGSWWTLRSGRRRRRRGPTASPNGRPVLPVRSARSTARGTSCPQGQRDWTTYSLDNVGYRDYKWRWGVSKRHAST